MALSRVNRFQENSPIGFGTGTYTTGSFTPANNTLLLAIVYGIEVSDTGMEGDDLTLSGGGLSWTPRVDTLGFSPNWSFGIRAWTAPVVTGASMTLAIDCGAFDIAQYRVEVYEYSDYDTGTPTGGTAAGEDVDGDGPLAITLSSAPETTSEVIAMVGHALNTDTNGSVTPGSAWTELFEGDLSSQFGWTQSQFRNSSTSTTVDWVDIEATGDSGGACALAIEIRQAGGVVSTGVGHPSSDFARQPMLRGPM